MNCIYCSTQRFDIIENFSQNTNKFNLETFYGKFLNSSIYVLTFGENYISFDYRDRDQLYITIYYNKKLSTKLFRSDIINIPFISLSTSVNGNTHQLLQNPNYQYEIDSSNLKVSKNNNTIFYIKNFKEDNWNVQIDSKDIAILPEYTKNQTYKINQDSKVSYKIFSIYLGIFISLILLSIGISYIMKFKALENRKFLFSNNDSIDVINFLIFVRGILLLLSLVFAIKGLESIYTFDLKNKLVDIFSIVGISIFILYISILMFLNFKF